jgi:hypothetical protein
VNGQTHGTLTLDFFRRKTVGLSLLADSIIVIVDCSRISGRAREDLFMNSRDRLSNGRLRGELEEELEELLHHHPGLRELKERRKREEVQSQATDAKPLETILENLIKQHRTHSIFNSCRSRLTMPWSGDSHLWTHRGGVANEIIRGIAVARVAHGGQIRHARPSRGADIDRERAMRPYR